MEATPEMLENFTEYDVDYPKGSKPSNLSNKILLSLEVYFTTRKRFGRAEATVQDFFKKRLSGLKTEFRKHRTARDLP